MSRSTTMRTTQFSDQEHEEFSKRGFLYYEKR